MTRRKGICPVCTQPAKLTRRRGLLKLHVSGFAGERVFCPVRGVAAKGGAR